MKKSRRAGTQIPQKKTAKPVPLAENLSLKTLKKKRRAPIQRSIQEREDALRSNARVVSVEPMMHSSRLPPTPAKKDGFLQAALGATLARCARKARNL